MVSNIERPLELRTREGDFQIFPPILGRDPDSNVVEPRKGHLITMLKFTDHHLIWRVTDRLSIRLSIMDCP